MHFKEQRDKEGVVCKRCGALPIIGYRVNGVMNAKVAVSAPRCAAVRSWRAQAAVSGVVQNDVPDELHKKGFSTNELQKQLGLKRYEPVWAMVHKLRRAMGNRDARYTLEGMIELDEGYFSVASKEIERGKGTRGRGAEESRTLR